MEGIVRRFYPEPDRNEVQESVAREVEADPESFFVRYAAHPQSFEGRYVCSDLFKETFPEFSASPAARARYNNPLHNTAAVLASEQFRRMVADPNAPPEQDTVIFLTGVPGAGKTTAVLSNDQLDPNVRVVYEGQLARPATVLPKIQQVLDAGMKPVIIAVHTHAEVALGNTLRRFEREGRGASVEAMASIQGELPNGLRAIHERFGEKVEFQLFDRRGGMNTVVEWEGWEHVSQLESEGTYEHLKHRLRAALDGHEAAGVFSADAIAQARGLAPRARHAGLHPADGREPADPRPGSSQGSAQVGVGDPEAAKAESAQARGIEADQARLQDQFAGERYQTALQTYLQANTQRIERIESQLETLIENQQAVLGELAAQRPGFFASAAAKAGWSADMESGQERLRTLRNRLTRVEEFREQSGELAEDEMREREPEIARAWDAARQARRSQQASARADRASEHSDSQDQEQGREREL